MDDKFNKTDQSANKLRLLKGARKRDIYDDAKWTKRPIDMDGEAYFARSVFDPELEQDGEDALRDKAKVIIEQITDDPIERSIGDLMLENYTEKEIANILNIGLARVEWFMRKIQGWKMKDGKFD
jgi:hypothetical protein